MNSTISHIFNFQLASIIMSLIFQFLLRSAGKFGATRACAPTTEFIKPFFTIEIHQAYYFFVIFFLRKKQWVMSPQNLLLSIYTKILAVIYLFPIAIKYKQNDATCSKLKSSQLRNGC